MARVLAINYAWFLF